MCKNELDEIYNYYLENGTKLTDKKFGIKGCSTKLKRNGYKIRTLKESRDFNSRKRFDSFNIDFKNINSEESAYILGLIFSDGCVSEKRALTAIIQKDFKILNIIKNIVGGSNGLVKSSSSDGVYQLNFYSRKLARNIIKFGIGESRGRKKESYVDINSIDDNLKRHFVRGFFDGDGFFTIQNRSVVIGFSLVNKKFLEDLKSYLEMNGLKNGNISLVRKAGSKCKIKGKSYITNYDTYSLRFSNKESVKAFSKLIYENSNLKLDRKFNSITNYENTVLTD